ncbi:MAG: cyclic nucleotide-binding/CBS domain-containing protein [Gammaproteobacteria bacterium]|nr:cyclic nucleotide-binding/CBS domain-containing protein [Gammaproteobacteria bacterium]
MEIELIEIRDFIMAHPPFDVLDKVALNELTNTLTIKYMRRGNTFSELNEINQYLYIIRTGAIEFRDKEKQLKDKLAEGDIYYSEDGNKNIEQAICVEDSILYLLPITKLNQFRLENKDFDLHFNQSINERLRNAVELTHAADMRDLSAMQLEVNSLTDRKPVIVDVSMSIKDAAQIMTAEQVSSILVTENNILKGLLTDQDIRSRCVAQDLSFSQPVSRIMTTDLETVESTTLLSQALLAMTRKQVQHLPIIKNDVPIGILTSSDIVRHLTTSPTLIATDIYKANSIKALKKISVRLPELQLQLSLSSATAKHIGEVFSSITDAITCRLIELAEAELGTAPVSYVWAAGGSQARNEQTSHTDQDNALIISDEYKDEHADYFKALANFVCDGLNDCGYVYCPGNAMASNDEWRQPIKVWHSYFSKWISEPEPKSLMLSSIFFDLRPVYGDTALFDDLQVKMLNKTKKNQLFISHMIGNALTHKPPLGFFRNFLMVQDDKHKNALNIKHRGVVPIVDIARVVALKHGLKETNTVERLHAAFECKGLSREMSENLIDALEFISSLRIRHQAEQIRKGVDADNFLPIEELSGLEKSHLKDSFEVIKTMQHFFESRIS